MRLRRALTVLLCAAAATAATLPAAPAAAAPPLVAPGEARVDADLAADLAALPATTPYAAVAHFRGGTAAERAAVLVDHGLTPGRDFDSVFATYAVGTLGDVAALRRDPLVSYLEAPADLRYLGETATWATRVREAQHAAGAGPYRDAAGRVLDGTGVGIAVIDAGVDGAHPDLVGRMAGNFKITCAQVVFYSAAQTCPTPVVTAADNTDLVLGHGTHVAGIAAGDGTASRGTYRGVAPGASLFGFSIETGPSYLYVAEAVDYIVRNYAALTPRIRVVNNSWGDPAGTAYDPNDLFSKLVRQLVAKGVTFTFAAGNGDALNNGGTGTDDRLSSTAKDPTPGVVTVANYDDGETGTRNGTLDSSSSRGKKGTLSGTGAYAYPDVSAPGTRITATCSPRLADCAPGVRSQWAPHYSFMSGTSMAAPHVAGIAALMYQADPALTPARVEELLKDTAHKFGAPTSYEADPANPGGTVSFDKGAGLVDAVAALDALGAAHDGGEVRGGTPSLRVGAPASGTVSDGAAPVVVSGTAADGWVAPAPFTPTTLVADERNDVPSQLAGAADIGAVTALETPDGIRVTIGLRDVADLGVNGLVGLYLQQNVNGTEFQTIVDLDRNGARARAYHATNNNAVATAIAVDPVADTVSYLLRLSSTATPDTSLRNPPGGSVARNVQVLAYSPQLVDAAPGGQGHEADTHPRFGAPYTIRRPSTAPRPAASVLVSVDGGPAQPAALTGTGGSYDWSLPVDAATLADGDHTAVATLRLDGVAVATDAVGFTVRRPVVVTYALDILAPTDGATLPREVSLVQGSAATNAPAELARRVTVQVTGASYDSGELAADGTDSWSLPLDVDALAGGTYLVTARLYVGDGPAVATDTVGVVVPAAPVLVSCAPQGLSFWQAQFNGGSKAVFTAAEAAALADRAVVLSTGYFKDRQSLVNVLYAKGGKLPAETVAARQFAALLLNRAAGDLSATMSRQVGLSGREPLDPAVYDTGRVGTTVETAVGWVRAQLPSGNLAGANEVATALNTDTGLAC